MDATIRNEFTKNWMRQSHEFTNTWIMMMMMMMMFIIIIIIIIIITIIIISY